MDEAAIAKLLKEAGNDPVHDVALIAILGLILAMMVVRWFLERKSTAPAAAGCPSRNDISDVKSAVDSLVAAHAQRDADGVPRWYIKSSTVQSITDTEAAVARVERAVADLVERCRRCDRAGP